MTIEQFVISFLREVAFNAVLNGTPRQSAAGVRFLRESQRVST